MDKKNYLIANIIPLIPLPPNSPDYFTYFTEIYLDKGSLVEIDFRKKKILGIIYEVKNVQQARKDLLEILPKIKKITKIVKEKTIINEDEFTFAKFLSSYFGFSFSSIFKFFFFPSKRFLDLNLKKEEKKNKRFFKINYFEKLNLKILRKKRSLIIIPEKSFAQEVEEILKEGKFSYRIFIPPWNKRKIEEISQELNKNEKIALIISKNLIFLPWKNIDQIVVYREGSFFYYDSFKKINFDYREIIKKLAEIKKLELTYIDSFPSLEKIKKLKIKPTLNLNIHILNSLEEALESLKNFSKIIIFFSQKVSSGVRCLNCFNLLQCPQCQSYLFFDKEKFFCFQCLKEIKIEKNECPFCFKPLEVSLKKIGVKTLYSYLKKNYAEVYFVEKKEKKFFKNMEKREKFIFLGSLSLISGYLKHAEASYFFNFENFYLSSDPFLREKYLRILNFLKEKTKTIFLISSIRNPEWEKSFLKGDYPERLLKERELLRLNPFYQVIKLIKGSSDFYFLQNYMIKISKELKEKLKNQEIEVLGPIFSKPHKIKKRFFLEIILRSQKEDIKIREIVKEYGFEKIKINPLEI